MTHAIRIENITVTYGDKNILENISLLFEANKITTIIGPNGCGKSTLLRTINGLISPSTGEVFVEEQKINTLNRKQLAKYISFLEQSPTAPMEMKILQLVKLGRYCHQSLLQQWTPEDEAAVEKALKQAGVWDLRHRSLADVSGGQLQRAWWAMCLAQNSKILLLDEPINHLDITYQLECLDAVKELNQNEQKTIIMVLHDINLAMRYADTIIAINADGEIYSCGSPNEIITPELFADVFHVKGHITQCPDTSSPFFIAQHRIA